jgi:hypothetical protein
MDMTCSINGEKECIWYISGMIRAKVTSRKIKK